MSMSNVVRYCKVCTLVATIMVCAGIFPGQAANAQSLMFGLGDSETPPRKWKKEGEYVGVYVDIIKELISRSDIKIDLKPYPHRRLVAYLRKGVIDGAVGLFKTAEREKIATYVDIPIAWASMQVFVKRGKAFSLKNINDLSGKVIGKVRGVSVGKNFDQAMQQGTFSIEETATYEQSILKLQAERIDALVGPGASTQFLLKEIGRTKEIVMLPHPLDPPRPLYVLFSKAAITPEKEALIEKIRQALMDMERDKVFEQILEKYGVVMTQ